MGKGKRRAFNDPAKQLEALQKSSDDVIKAFGGKGFTTDIDDGWIQGGAGGYIWAGGTPKGKNGFWDIVQLQKQIEEDKKKPVPTVEDWADKWAAENGIEKDNGL